MSWMCGCGNHNKYETRPCVICGGKPPEGKVPQKAGKTKSVPKPQGKK